MITNDNKLSNRQNRINRNVYNKRLVKRNKSLTKVSGKLVRKSESGSMVIIAMLLIALILLALVMSQSTGSGVLDSIFSFLKSLLG